jgi:hypothetical protein
VCLPCAVLAGVATDGVDTVGYYLNEGINPLI